MAIQTMGAALHHINRLFSEGTVSGLPDDQLLDRFLATRDGAAFEVLMARHGPMVLRVCRSVLRNPSDAEDAFQATFLVLVKKARTLRGRANLGGWLHLVAYRVAIQANAAAARRRVQERRAGEMSAVTPSQDPVIPDELIPALHEEIARLPERLRLAVVLCDLQGIPQAQTAESLRWSERTLQRRLAEGRERLKARLGRRGLGCSGAILAAVRLREAGTVLPPAWRESTIRAALDLLNPTLAAGAASAAAQSLTDGVLKTMFVQKLAMTSAGLLGAGLMAWAAAVLTTQGDGPPKTATAPVGQRAAPASRPEVRTDPLDAAGTFPIHGRVLDPGGRPVAGAEVFIRHFTSGSSPVDPTPKGQKVCVAISGANGHFRFELDKASSDSTWTDDPAWHEAEIAAVVAGFGPAWIKAGTVESGGEATLRLVHDDVPIRGRLLDSQGRPAAGVVVRIERIGVAPRGTNPDTMLASGEVDRNMVAQTWSRMNPTWYDKPSWLGQQGTWTTDADGRFEIRGIGRDRIVHLKFESPALEHAVLYVMARRSQAPTKPRPHHPRTNPPLVAAAFDHVLGPTKLITGVVRLRGTTKPLAGVPVWGTERTSGTHVSALTDAQGRFRIVGLPKGESYEISAQPQSGVHPFLPAGTVVTDTAGLKPIETTLELPKGIIVTGRLIDKSIDRPVPAKYVQWSTLPSNSNSSGSALSHSSTADPVFRVTVLPGAGVITAKVLGDDSIYTRARVSKEDEQEFSGLPSTSVWIGASNAYRVIDVPAGAESISVDLGLTSGVSRKGKLVGPDGQPVSGAQCYGLRARWGYITTLPDDRFEVHGMEPGHSRLVTFAHRERQLVGSVVLKDEDLKTDSPLEVRLGPAASIKGRLVDEDGLPLAGATLMVRTDVDPGEAYLARTPGYCLWPDDEDFVADADGRFQVLGLTPGVKSSIIVRSNDRTGLRRVDTGDVFRSIVLREPGEVHDLGDVTATPRGPQ